MGFLKYQHIEKLGTPEVRDIEFGECYIFPKIDGTNSSVWIENDSIHCGSRNRELSIENDNAGFMEWVTKQPQLKTYLLANPSHVLYGEWLVPHSLKTYASTAWRDFYVFDVFDTENAKWIPFNSYEPNMKAFGINYIPPLGIVKNATYENFIEYLHKNIFLIEDGKGVGEGIVIKRYDFRNKYGRTTWAKIVTSEFKKKHAKEMGAPKVEYKNLVEQELAEAFVTTALVEKEFAKICNETQWSNKQIPRLLNVVFYCLIKEEMWEMIRSLKQNKSIDFGRLQHFAFAEVRKKKPELF